jgi:F-type H+-transporting ATPase subunit delta
MSEIRISSRYAKALLDQAVSTDKLEKIHQDALFFLETCDKSRDLFVMLQNPVIAREIKHRIIKRVFEKNVDPLTYHFMLLVLRKRREPLFKDIFDSFIRLYNVKMHISYAKVYSAVNIPDHFKQEITAMVADYTKTEVRLENKINKDLIGGFVLRFGDKLLEASVRSRLNELQKHLNN